MAFLASCRPEASVMLDLGSLCARVFYSSWLWLGCGPQRGHYQFLLVSLQLVSVQSPQETCKRGPPDGISKGSWPGPYLGQAARPLHVSSGSRQGFGIAGGLLSHEVLLHIPVAHVLCRLRQPRGHLGRHQPSRTQGWAVRGGGLSKGSKPARAGQLGPCASKVALCYLVWMRAQGSSEQELVRSASSASVFSALES